MKERPRFGVGKTKPIKANLPGAARIFEARNTKPAPFASLGAAFEPADRTAFVAGGNFLKFP